MALPQRQGSYQILSAVDQPHRVLDDSSIYYD